MATLTDYKSLDVLSTDIGDTNITGDGGRAINDDFLKLADRAPMLSDSDPGASDDEDEGYFPGSLWFNDSTRTMWVCTDATASGAVWKSLYRRDANTLVLCPEEDGDVRVNEGLTVRLKSGQTGTMTEWQDSAADHIASIDEDGTYKIQTHPSGFTLYELDRIFSSWSSFAIQANFSGGPNAVDVKVWDGTFSEFVLRLRSPNSIIIDAGNHLILKDLPTSDPSVAGALWDDSGTLKVSAG